MKRIYSSTEDRSSLLQGGPNINAVSSCISSPFVLGNAFTARVYIP
jgi:hypothetical protein